MKTNQVSSSLVVIEIEGGGLDYFPGMIASFHPKSILLRPLVADTQWRVALRAG